MEPSRRLLDKDCDTLNVPPSLISQWFSFHRTDPIILLTVQVIGHPVQTHTSTISRKFYKTVQLFIYVTLNRTVRTYEEYCNRDSKAQTLEL